MGFSLDDLAALIATRKQAQSDSSYTKSLLDAGIERCAKKFGEEAVELVIAGMKQNQPEIVNEAADVFYHLLVVLAASDVPLESVLAELARRTAQSGIAEKAGRKV